MVKVLDNVTTSMVLSYNGKFGGGRMMLSPPSIINDGYQELYTPDKSFSKLEVL